MYCWVKLKDGATRCVFRPPDAPKCVFGPTGRAYSAPLDPLAEFWEENKEGDGKGQDGKERKREKKEEEE